MLMIGLALVGGLIFLFVIVPQFVQLFFRFFGGGDLGLNQDDTVPPQVPIISPLPEATSESTLELQGFGEAGSQVVIVLNGNELDRIEVDDQGEFSYSLNLEEGENQLVIFGVDEAENESNSRQLVIALDTKAPSLAFESLENGQEVLGRNNQQFVIRGETEPGSSLSLNDKNVYVALDGTFNTTYFLSEGENTLRFMVTDKAGNQIEREVKLNFRY